MRSKSTKACFAAILSLLICLTGCTSNNDISETPVNESVTDSIEETTESNKLQNSGSKNESSSSPTSNDKNEDYYYVLETNSAISNENKEDEVKIQFKDVYSNYGTPIILDESDINIPLSEQNEAEDTEQEILEEKQEQIKEELWEEDPMVGLPPLDNEYWYVEEEEEQVEIEYWYNEETGLWETTILNGKEDNNIEEIESEEIVESQEEIEVETPEVKRQRIAYEINKFVYQDIYLNGVSLLDNVKSEDDFNSKHKVSLNIIFSLAQDNFEKLERADKAIKDTFSDNQSLIKSWDKLYKELKVYRETLLSMEKCKEVVSNKDKLKSNTLSKLFNNFSNTIITEVGDYSPIPEYRGNTE